MTAEIVQLSPDQVATGHDQIEAVFEAAFVLPPGGAARCMASLANRTAILSTLPGNTSALALYRKRGWVELLRDYHFPGNRKAYLFMGKDLP